MSDLIDRQGSDCISRQAAIDALDSINCFGWVDDSWAKVSGIIKHVPSEQPERKTGKWLKAYGDHEAFGVRPFYRYCSECNESTVFQYKFCPNCGCRMMEVEHEHSD